MNPHVKIRSIKLTITWLWARKRQNRIGGLIKSARMNPKNPQGDFLLRPTYLKSRQSDSSDHPEHHGEHCSDHWVRNRDENCSELSDDRENDHDDASTLNNSHTANLMEE